LEVTHGISVDLFRPTFHPPTFVGSLNPRLILLPEPPAAQTTFGFSSRQLREPGCVPGSADSIPGGLLLVPDLVPGDAGVPGFAPALSPGGSGSIFRPVVGCPAIVEASSPGWLFLPEVPEYPVVSFHFPPELADVFAGT